MCSTSQFRGEVFNQRLNLHRSPQNFWLIAAARSHGSFIFQRLALAQVANLRGRVMQAVLIMPFVRLDVCLRKFSFLHHSLSLHVSAAMVAWIESCIVALDDVIVVAVLSFFVQCTVSLHSRWAAPGAGTAQR